MHQAVEARTIGRKTGSGGHTAVSRSKSVINRSRVDSSPLDRGLSSRGTRNDLGGNQSFRSADSKAVADKKFRELLAKQLDLLSLHRKQFEAVLNSELDVSFLPD